jgi:hypothetical protein
MKLLPTYSILRVALKLFFFLHKINVADFKSQGFLLPVSCPAVANFTLLSSQSVHYLIPTFLPLDCTRSHLI